MLDCVILGTTISYPARPNETVSMVSTRVYDEYRQLLRYKKPMRVKVLITSTYLLATYEDSCTHQLSPIYSLYKIKQLVTY